jgi:hypothetical protein
MAAPVHVGEHGLVLGASMAGLVTARVLSDHFDRVTVVERDLLPEGPEHRRGLPQDRHPHLLQAGGARALDELFPGLLDELEAGGSAVVVEDYSRFYFDVGATFWATPGRRSTRRPSTCRPGPSSSHRSGGGSASLPTSRSSTATASRTSQPTTSAP